MKVTTRDWQQKFMKDTAVIHEVLNFDEKEKQAETYQLTWDTHALLDSFDQIKTKHLHGS